MVELRGYNVRLITGDGEAIPLGGMIEPHYRKERPVGDKLYATDVVLEAERPEEPESYPRIGVGETVEVKGYPFVVVRLNASSIVLRPVPNDGRSRSRRVMREMEGPNLHDLVNEVIAFVDRYSKHATAGEIRRVRGALGELRGFGT